MSKSLQGIDLVLIGHGVRGPNAPTLRQAHRELVKVRGKHAFKSVLEAYLEDAPDLHTVLRSVSGDVLVIVYFANHGLHATEDVTRLIRQSESSAH